LGLPAIVSPDFGHAERGIDWKLGQRFVRRFDFHNDVGWRIRLQVDLASANDSLGIGNVETEA